MNSAEWLSLGLNVALGLFFAYLYPRWVARRLGEGRLPPAFQWAVAALQPLGLLLIGGSLVYATLRLLGAL